MVVAISLQPYIVMSQSIPVTKNGVNRVVDFLEINENIKPDASLLIRPINYNQATTDSTEGSYSILSSGKNSSILKILNPFVYYNFTKEHPYNRNDRGIFKSSGSQLEINGGIFLDLSFLEVQLRPSLIYLQNRNYKTFTDFDPELRMYKRSNWWNQVDDPEFFDGSNELLFLPGDSFLKFRLGDLGAGLSSEYMWWGPGRFNAIIMSNNAESFPYLFLQSEKPISSKIGVFEFKVILGLLKSSGMVQYDTSYQFQKSLFAYLPTQNDRIINGLVMTYQPKWLSGFTLGFAKTIQQYKDRFRERQDYFPLITEPFKNKQNYDGLNGLDHNQSLFFKLKIPGKFSLYGEYGNYLDDFKIHKIFTGGIEGPGYLFGIHKIFDTNKDSRFIESGLEFTRLQQSAIISRNRSVGWYINESIRQGYTNNGQLLGAGIGPGGNMQNFFITLHNNQHQFGIKLERWEHNQDFYHFNFGPVGDYRSWWIDYSLGLNSTLELDNFRVFGEFNTIYSFNYQWDVDAPDDALFPKTNDVWNFMLSLHIDYKF